MMKQRVIFTVGPVHTRDHGPGCSGADPESAARQKEVGLILCPFRNITVGRESALPRTPGGPQVDPEVGVA